MLITIFVKPIFNLFIFLLKRWHFKKVVRNFVNFLLLSPFFADATSNGDATTLQNRLHNLGTSAAGGGVGGIGSSGSAGGGGSIGGLGSTGPVMLGPNNSNVADQTSPHFSHFGFVPTGNSGTGSQRFNFGSSHHSQIPVGVQQQQNNNYQNGESSRFFFLKKMGHMLFTA